MMDPNPHRKTNIPIPTNTSTTHNGGRQHHKQTQPSCSPLQYPTNPPTDQRPNATRPTNQPTPPQHQPTIGADLVRHVLNKEAAFFYTVRGMAWHGMAWDVMDDSLTHPATPPD